MSGRWEFFFLFTSSSTPPKQTSGKGLRERDGGRVQCPSSENKDVDAVGRSDSMARNPLPPGCH